jgi:polyisoprenyl-phosphate glycosyltransferase
MDTVIIPAFNEEKSILEVIRRVHVSMKQSQGQKPFEIIVVDDGSTDATPALLSEITATYKELVVVTHPMKKGVGCARTTAVLRARGERVAFIDADLTYEADDLPRLFDSLETYDMAVGAREEEKGSLRYLRATIKSIFKSLASLLTRSRIEDLNSGIRAMNKAKTIEFLPMLPSGHSWVSTITLCFLASGYSVGFIPTRYFVRTGKSSFKIFRDSYAMLLTIIKTVIYFYPLRVILPVSYLFFFGGFCFLIRDIFQHNIADTTILFFVMGVITFVFALMSEQISCLRREINQKIDSR